MWDGTHITVIELLLFIGAMYAFWHSWKVVLFVHLFRIEAIAFVESLKKANFLLLYLDVISRACFSALSTMVTMDV